MTPPERGGSRRRLRGLLRKEFLQVLRDPSSLAIAFLMPVVLLLLFGYGISLDARHVPIAFVANAPSPESEGLLGAFRHSIYFEPVTIRNLPEAQAALRSHRVDAIVHLQSDFAVRLRDRGDDQPAPVQLIVNGVDANQARLIENYVSATWQGWLNGQTRLEGHAPTPPVALASRVWFNAELRSQDYLVPGLIAVIMTMIGAMLTALVMAREWERGTMEALMVTPVTLREILLGKLIPYFVLGMGGMALSVAMAVFLFEVPLRGSLAVLTLASALFMLVSLGMGLLISIVSRNQFVAGIAAIITTFLPAFILSGFIFDINSMPGWLQAFTHVIGARYFVTLLQTLFLAGTIWAVILPNALALAVMAIFFIGVSRLRMHKRLD
ncbi:MAG: ABC transporter permease [Halothiobacillaceae bacterium]